MNFWTNCLLDHSSFGSLGLLDHWIFVPSDFWTISLLDHWTFERLYGALDHIEVLGFWTFGLLVFWAFGLLVFWTIVFFVLLEFGTLDFCNVETLDQRAV